MPDLEKPDNQNDNAQSGNSQGRNIIKLPEHLSQQDDNLAPRQQTSEENKESISYENRLRKNEPPKEPTVHEKILY
ncbi:MAG: hypothetical protein LBT58_02730 [Endomicrobium sp.]|jgi:hypothetical protein|nr:hypothetical protein [Endomicrobium sp.]